VEAHAIENHVSSNVKMDGHVWDPYNAKLGLSVSGATLKGRRNNMTSPNFSVQVSYQVASEGEASEDAFRFSCVCPSLSHMG